MSVFTDTELALLRRLAGRMIPASAEYAVPGADDETIFADLVRTLEPGAERVQAMLASLDAGAIAALPAADLDETIQTLRRTHAVAMGGLISVLFQCYYRDDRVMRSIGMEPRPPFPKGYDVEQGDWSLLDPVRARSSKIWRDTP